MLHLVIKIEAANSARDQKSEKSVTHFVAEINK